MEQEETPTDQVFAKLRQKMAQSSGMPQPAPANADTETDEAVEAELSGMARMLREQIQTHWDERFPDVPFQESLLSEVIRVHLDEQRPVVRARILAERQKLREFSRQKFGWNHPWVQALARNIAVGATIISGIYIVLAAVLSDGSEDESPVGIVSILIFAGLLAASVYLIRNKKKDNHP